MKAILSFVADDGSPAGLIEFDSVRKVPIFKAVRDGAASSAEIDLADYSAAVIAHWLDYGIKQNLNDATASVNGKAADAFDKAMSAVQKRLDTFARGEVRSNAGGPRVDAVRREALDTAESHVRAWYKANNKKITGDEKRIAEIAADCVRDSMTPKGRHFDYLANAKVTVDARAAAMTDTDDVEID